MLTFIETWMTNRRTVAQLSRLSDHALADLGIARPDIAAVTASAAKSQRVTDRESSFPLPGHRHVPAWA